MTIPKQEPKSARSDRPTLKDQSATIKNLDVPVETHALVREVHNSQVTNNEHYKLMLSDLKRRGTLLRADQCQPDLHFKPIWLDEGLMENAKSVYERHFMGMSFAHLSGLLLLVRVDSIYKTLSSTGQSNSVSKLFKRYYHTVKHIKSWYEGDLFDKENEAHRSLMIVRGMHNKVSSKFNDRNQHAANGTIGNGVELINSEAIESVEKKTIVPSSSGVHISEYDIMLTQFAFIGFIVTSSNRMGLIDDFSSRDLESLLHFWRVIGYYLGASKEFNLCSYEVTDVIGLCNAIIATEYKESILKNRLSDPPGIMSVNIVRSVKFIPMLTVYGIMRYLYEILGCDYQEVDGRRTWYSNLSYTLIKLVMTRLLGYKALRSFNNGLTRLSLFMVGKIEGWFAQHLESSYGSELKI